ncbi:bifunctional DNA primase/polymerase [Streptomyces sp. NPDC090052]|uniref:bifunctional DNA primase/polymerase n=1 Tax=unclassified Streptomyces TaxID=2593676 RepID=UPI002256664E|nr:MULTISPECIES: bifunctional DNA primase/polymerase [unclassified Streptomyces]MCX4726937.1 bifunctional DNA primase/polymerase [Streptomyces sp. NBC_01306]WSV03788.1 bifunctional DNA primase/polymerase [Streptomyces sp. NBC_01020]WSX41830.1 bifunctional DNA primase/polymerase [Streptomyces sp. NBC_00963]WSX70213.1 bifunctional DNA primase/polymerase [Streptomyces sp. NBC_00932]
MGTEFGRDRGPASRMTQWLRRRPRQSPDDNLTREKLFVAAAEAGLPLSPAAHPVGYRCSCDRVGCPTPARHPLSFAWQTQSTTDRAQVERWVRNQPEANFITATGMVLDVLDVPLDAGRSALERLLADGIQVGPVAQSGIDRMLFFTATRGTPEDEDEWWPCELDCHPETMDEHPGLRWHCRGSYVLVPPARLPGEASVDWVRGLEHPLPDPLTLLETLTDACARHADGDQDAHAVAWPLGR